VEVLLDPLAMKPRERNTELVTKGAEPVAVKPPTISRFLSSCATAGKVTAEHFSVFSFKYQHHLSLALVLTLLLPLAMTKRHKVISHIWKESICFLDSSVFSSCLSPIN
jgi:hypothetical protein